MEKKKILVTGAAGFIGSQLCKRLSDAGHDVSGIDNFNSHLYNQKLKTHRHNNFNIHFMYFFKKMQYIIIAFLIMH